MHRTAGGLFLPNVLQPMDVVAHLRVGTGSGAASGIAQWFGSGHLEATDLWGEEEGETS